MMELRDTLPDYSLLWGMVADCRDDFFGDNHGVNSPEEFVTWLNNTVYAPLFGFVDGQLATFTYLCGCEVGEKASIHCLVSPAYRKPSVSLTLGRMCFDLYFDILGLHKLEGVVAEYNRTARAMCRRLGFTQDGILREHMVRDGERVNCVLYSLLRSEHNGQR
jgi:RimJ/RimL family protein N-acetyltransferase